MRRTYHLSSFILIFFWALLLFACSTNTEESNSFHLEVCEYKLPILREYKNENLKFSIGLPEDYVINEGNEIMQLIVVRNYADEKYIESLGANIFVNSSNYGLSEIFKEDSEYDILDYKRSDAIQDFVVLGKGDALINDYDSRWIAYSYGGNSELALLVFYFKHENLAYKFSLACNQENFQTIACKFVGIMESITFI